MMKTKSVAKAIAFNALAMLALVLTAMPAGAVPNGSTDTDYFNRNAEGWFWYQDPPPEPEEETSPEPESRQQASPDPFAGGPADPLERLEAIQKAIERAKARAVLEPTEENLAEYLRLNQWQLDQSARFADVWRRVVWQTPELDYSLRRPTMNLAVHEYQDQRSRTRARAVAEVAKTHGLFFFFKGSCPYCHVFSPILRKFSEAYGIEILPISLDGGTLPEFPRPRVDTRVAAELGVKTVPSVFLVDPARRNVIPVGSGVMSMQDLVERIYVLTRTRPGEDF